jgi:disulfide bond formation protein DsbB
MLNFSSARLLAVLLPAALIGGAYFSQYFGGMYPCEMCWWQRYPHFVAVPIALLAFPLKNPGAQRVCSALAALAIFTSGLIGGFHAGVEYQWWEGFTACTSNISGSGEDFLKSIMNAPLTRCDVAPWTMAGISLAGYNFLLSCCGAIAILYTIWKPKMI